MEFLCLFLSAVVLALSALFLLDHHDPAFFTSALFLSAVLIDHPAGYLFRIPLCSAVTHFSFLCRHNLIISLILSMCLYCLSVVLPQSGASEAGLIRRVAFCLAGSSLSFPSASALRRLHLRVSHRLHKWVMFGVVSAFLNPVVSAVIIFVGAPLILPVCVVWFLRKIPKMVAAIPPEAPLGDGGEELGLQQVDEIQPVVEEYREASAGAAIPPEAPLGDGGEELGLQQVDEIQPVVEEYREYDEVEVPPPPQFPANHGQRYFQSGRYTLVPMIRAPPTYAEIVRELREPILVPRVNPPTRRRRR